MLLPPPPTPGMPCHCQTPVMTVIIRHVACQSASSQHPDIIRHVACQLSCSHHPVSTRHLSCQSSSDTCHASHHQTSVMPVIIRHLSCQSSPSHHQTPVMPVIIRHLSCQSTSDTCHASNHHHKRWIIPQQSSYYLKRDLSSVLCQSAPCSSISPAQAHRK
jgi:hypothetical protein